MVAVTVLVALAIGNSEPGLIRACRPPRARPAAPLQTTWPSLTIAAVAPGAPDRRTAFASALSSRVSTGLGVAPLVAALPQDEMAPAAAVTARSRPARAAMRRPCRDTAPRIYTAERTVTGLGRSASLTPS